MPHSASSLPPSKRHSRLTIVRRGCRVVTNRRDSWRSHVHRTRLRSACSSSSCSTCQWRGQGAEPLAFSWGFKGAILSRERMAPFAAPCAAQGIPLQPSGSNEPVKRYCFNSLLISRSASAVHALEKSTQGRYDCFQRVVRRLLASDRASSRPLPEETPPRGAMKRSFAFCARVSSLLRHRVETQAAVGLPAHMGMRAFVVTNASPRSGNQHVLASLRGRSGLGQMITSNRFSCAACAMVCKHFIPQSRAVA